MPNIKPRSDNEVCYPPSMLLLAPRKFGRRLCSWSILGYLLKGEKKRTVQKSFSVGGHDEMGRVKLSSHSRLVHEAFNK